GRGPRARGVAAWAPADPVVLSMLARTAIERDHDLASAERFYEAALRPNPTHRSTIIQWLAYLIRAGDLDRGREHLRAYMARQGRPVLWSEKVPEWDGSSVDGKTVLLDGSIGFGDCLQFCRFARLLRDDGASVELLCLRQLHTLMASVDGVARVTEMPSNAPAADVSVYSPVACLLYDCSLTALGAMVPYVKPTTEASDAW